jgi:hypothetical protein
LGFSALELRAVPPAQFEHRRRETTAKLAALMLANAFIFQEQLSSLEKNVRPIRQMLAERDFIERTADHWKMIIETINYVPIFKVARDILLSLPEGPDTQKSVRNLAKRSLEIVSKKAALRHDLMGRIYHLLLHEAKYLGTYYTSVPAATLLLRLCLDIDRWPDIEWSDQKALKTFRIADLACGTGTLLMAASQAVTDNYIRYRLSRNESVDDAALRELHKLIVEEMLHGYDVLPSAVHLTASTLALLAPETCFRKMRLYSLPMGRDQSGQIYLGSIDYIDANTVLTQLDLMSPGIGAESVGSETASVAPVPEIDLCVMNPPFVRSVGGNLLFGSIPDDRGEMQSELAQRLRSSKLSASSTAGLGSVFTAIGDRHLKEKGRIALVLPAAVTTGAAWEKTRELINHGYVLETVVTSHDPEQWNFSENTDLSEVLLIARKRRRDRKDVTAPHGTQFVNLWRNPKTSAHALAVGRALLRGAPAPIGSPKKTVHSVSEIMVGAEKYGESVEIGWDDVRTAPWLGGCFAQTNLVRAAWFLRTGRLYMGGENKFRGISICPLGELGSLGPDRRDIADGFTISGSRTRYPAVMGNRTGHIKTLAISPNKYLSPRTVPAKGRPARDIGLLWPKAGRVMLAERSWLNTQRALAIRVPQPSLANVWWPLRLHDGDELAEKALVLWFASTLGLLTMIAHRVPTRGAWVQFKKPTLERLPVLDTRELSRAQLKQLAGSFDTLAFDELDTLPNMSRDPVRDEIDSAIARVLGLPSLAALREELASEPVITLRRCDGGETFDQVEDVLQFELL